MGVREFRDTWLRSLKPRGKRYEEREAGGLGVWVYPSGKKAFVLTYVHAGRKERLVLGEYPALSLARARKRLQEARETLAEGQDPRAEREAEKRAFSAATAASRQTVAWLIAEFVERWARQRNRSWPRVEQTLTRVVEPVWGALPAAGIRRADVRALLAREAWRGPVSCNRLHGILSRLFNWAVEVELLEVSPVWKLRRPSPESARDRVLSPEEIRAFWWALEGFSSLNPVRAWIPAPQTVRALRALLVTGQRSGEIAGARWEEVEGEWWTVPAARAKNRIAHRVPLSPLARELFGAGRSGPVFAGAQGQVTVPGLARAVRAYRELSGAADFHPHDLRRTAASHMARLGVPRLVISRILNHTEGGITSVYDRHSYDREKREALEAWAAEVRRILY